MIRLAVIVLVVAAAAIGGWFSRRRATDAPTQASSQTPTQLDRADFAQPDVEWLVVVFTSASCNACADMATKAKVLESRQVAIQIIEYTQDRALHKRYAIDSVPCLLMADAGGVVRQSYLGPVTATDLWAGLARVREGYSREN